jgi:hypothetical protein
LSPSQSTGGWLRFASGRAVTCLIERGLNLIEKQDRRESGFHFREGNKAAETPPLAPKPVGEVLQWLRSSGSHSLSFGASLFALSPAFRNPRPASGIPEAEATFPNHWSHLESPEQWFLLARRTECQARATAEAIRSIGISEVTSYRGRQEFGGLKRASSPEPEKQQHDEGQCCGHTDRDPGDCVARFHPGHGIA